MAAYNPGDILVAELTIKGVDFKRTFITFDVYESLLMPGIVAKIFLLDPEDFIGEGKIAGGEAVNIAFKSPGSSTVDYKLVVNSIEKVQSTQAMKAKSYILTCCSEEVHKARNKYISKSYEKKQLSEMIKDIFDNFIGSSKSIDLEETKGLHNFVVPKLKPFEAIDTIRRRSISEQNKSSSFIFFENQDGYHFTTVEKLFRDGQVIKDLVQDSATGGDFFGAKGNAVLAVDIPQQVNAGETISRGYFNQSVRTFNFTTGEYKIKNDIKDPDKDTKKGGDGERTSSALKNKHSQEASRISVLPVNNHKDIGLNQKSYIPEQSPAQTAYADSISSSRVNVTAVGDSALKVGALVNANLLKKVSLSTAPTIDPALSGKFLVFNCRHRIKAPGERPRYTCEMQLVKGAFEDSFA